jgi:hypothetical protein
MLVSDFVSDLFPAGQEPPVETAKASDGRAGGGETPVNAKAPRGKDAKGREMGRGKQV